MTESPVVTVREARDGDAERWNGYLDEIEEASPLARYEWRRVLERSYGVPALFLIAERAGAIAGLLAGYEIRGWFGERRFFSVRCGMVAPERATAETLIEHLDTLGARRRWSALLLTSGWQALPGIRQTAVKKTVQITLDPDEKRMWTGLRAKTRNMVRRAERAGLRIVSGGRYVDMLFDHYVRNMLRLGVTPHSRRFFRELVRQLGPQVEILVALHEGRHIASMMLCFGRETACYPYQNVLYEHRKLAAIQYLNWMAMRRCAERGVCLLDMGESAEGSPVFRSKVHFGGTPRDVFYYERRATESDAARVSRPVMMARRLAAISDTMLTRHAPPSLRRLVAHRQILRKRLL